MAGARKAKNTARRGARMLAAQRRAAAGQGARTTAGNRAKSRVRKIDEEIKRSYSGRKAGKGESRHSKGLARVTKRFARRYAKSKARGKA